MIRISFNCKHVLHTPMFIGKKRLQGNDGFSLSFFFFFFGGGGVDSGMKLSQWVCRVLRMDTIIYKTPNTLLAAPSLIVWVELTCTRGKENNWNEQGDGEQVSLGFCLLQFDPAHPTLLTVPLDYPERDCQQSKH